MTDHIRLTGLRAYGYHGVLPEERTDGQLFVLDVELVVDLQQAAQSDQLSDTVDYSAIAARAVRVVEGKPCNLIETVAMRVLDEVMSMSDAEAVTVTVHKPQAPVGVPFDDVSVTLTRARS